MNQLLLHIRRISFAIQIDLSPQQHSWLEEQGRQVPWILLENFQANDNSERHNHNHVSQSQDDGVESATALWGMCDLDPQGSGQVLIQENLHKQHLWGDLDPDEDEQRLSGEVEVGKRIEKIKRRGEK